MLFDRTHYVVMHGFVNYSIVLESIDGKLYNHLTDTEALNTVSLLQTLTVWFPLKPRLCCIQHLFIVFVLPNSLGAYLLLYSCILFLVSTSS